MTENLGPTDQGRERAVSMKQRVLTLRARQWTYRRIADECGISVQRVWQILREAGATTPPAQPEVSAAKAAEASA